MSAAENDVKALLRAGFEALTRGDIPRASDCCQRALAIRPDVPQAHFLVGLTALEANQRETAFQAFGSVTRLDPANAAAWAHLARLFMGEGLVVRADAALAEAKKAGSRDPMVLDLMGSVYSLMGEYGLAAECFESAVSLRPDHPPFLLNLANNLVYFGETDAAVEILEKIVRIQPDSPQAHWSLSGARKASDDTHITVMARLVLAQSNPRARAFYYYAIGKELEDLGRWDDAFEAFVRGAGERRKTVEYDESAESAMFDYLAGTFTESWLASKGKGHEDESPIFVLGQPRTGTTLIDRIISAHSQVHSAGELQQLGLAIRRLSDYRDPKRFSVGFFEAARDIPAHRIGQVYLDTTKRVRGGAPRFIDKLPQNYLMIPIILAAMPRAKIVHLTRDPVDACFSSFKQLFADAYLHSYDLGEMARHHIRYRRLMSTWRERFGERFLDISYEETVSDLEPNARRLIDFLGLDWEPACLAFHEQATAVSTASAVQVREPAHTRSVGRWRRYSAQLEPMIRELAAAGLHSPVD
ncbi:MAG: sulfotransferase [Pseudomonadales bacterium]|nr:sulfotransferase [Pseudomonadales bacterium]